MPADQPTLPEIEPSFHDLPTWGAVFVCKYTAAPTSTLFDVDASATGGNLLGTSFNVASTQEVWFNPGCVEVWRATSSTNEQVTVTENLNAGWELYRVQVGGYDQPVNTTVTVTANNTSGNVWVLFKNRPREVNMLPGRMTGGGFQFTVDGVRVTRGFTIHCDITLSNNIEINWGAGNKWHLDKPISTAECVDDPTIDPAPPPAPFDTFHGTATGRLNGVDGSFLRFTFVDAGEPGGDTDRATINIWSPGANPAVDPPYLSVSGFIKGGNLQAHYDQPHG